MEQLEYGPAKDARKRAVCRRELRTEAFFLSKSSASLKNTGAFWVVTYSLTTCCTTGIYSSPAIALENVVKDGNQIKICMPLSLPNHARATDRGLRMCHR